MRGLFLQAVFGTLGVSGIISAQSTAPSTSASSHPMPFPCYSIGGSEKDMAFWRGRTIHVCHFVMTPEGARDRIECPDQLAIFGEGTAPDWGPPGQPERWLSLAELDQAIRSSEGAGMASARTHRLEWPVKLDRMDVVGPFAAFGEIGAVTGSTLLLSGRLQGHPRAFALFSLSEVEGSPKFTGFVVVPERVGPDMSVDISPTGRYALYSGGSPGRGDVWAEVEDLISGRRRRIHWRVDFESKGQWKLGPQDLVPDPHWTTQETLAFLEASPRFLFLERDNSNSWIPPIEDDPSHWPLTVTGRLHLPPQSARGTGHVTPHGAAKAKGPTRP